METINNVNSIVIISKDNHINTFNLIQYLNSNNLLKNITKGINIISINNNINIHNVLCYFPEIKKMTNIKYLKANERNLNNIYHTLLLRNRTGYILNILSNIELSKLNGEFDITTNIYEFNKIINRDKIDRKAITQIVRTKIKYTDIIKPNINLNTKKIVLLDIELISFAQKIRIILSYLAYCLVYGYDLVIKFSDNYFDSLFFKSLLEHPEFKHVYSYNELDSKYVVTNITINNKSEKIRANSQNKIKITIPKEPNDVFNFNDKEKGMYFNKFIELIRQVNISQNMKNMFSKLDTIVDSTKNTIFVNNDYPLLDLLNSGENDIIIQHGTIDNVYYNEHIKEQISDRIIKISNDPISNLYGFYLMNLSGSTYHYKNDDLKNTKGIFKLKLKDIEIMKYIKIKKPNNVFNKIRIETISKLIPKSQLKFIENYKEIQPHDSVIISTTDNIEKKCNYIILDYHQYEPLKEHEAGFLKKREPIQCRDYFTKNLLEKNNIKTHQVASDILLLANELNLHVTQERINNEVTIDDKVITKLTEPTKLINSITSSKLIKTKNEYVAKLCICLNTPVEFTKHNDTLTITKTPYHYEEIKQSLQKIVFNIIQSKI